MRTTVDLDRDLLRTVKERAARGHTTLSAIVQEALRAYFQSSERSAAEPFELLEAGTPGGKHPSPAEVSALLELEDFPLIPPEEG